MIKHAFGIKYANSDDFDDVRFSIYLDKIPDNKNQMEQFRQYLSAIPSSQGFQSSRITIAAQDIAEIDSHKHCILQGLDIILGSMHFRLNHYHKIKEKGARKRGKRTIAKEKLYNHINAKIREIYPNFNIGITTGRRDGLVDSWRHRYRHWLFTPTNSKRVEKY